MKLTARRLLLWWLTIGLLAGTPAIVHAQRAGLWEAQIAVDGRLSGAPVLSCNAADAALTVLAMKVPNCSGGTVRRTTTGFASETRCMGGLTISRAVTGDMNVRYETSMWTRFEGAGVQGQPSHHSVVTNRYVGACGQAAPREGGSVDKAPGTAASIFWFIAVFIPQMAAFAAAVYGSFVGMAWLSRQLMRRVYDRAIVANIAIDGAGAATIPVLATFTGVRGLPWWYGIASNNAKPLLVIEPDGIRFRVIRQTVRRYDEIEVVDVRQATGTVNLDITFSGSLLTFAANLGAVPLAAHVLSLLPPSVPLSSRAAALKEARA